MVDYKKLLDVVMGSIGRAASSPGAGHGTGGLIDKVGKQATDLAAQSPDQLLQRAKDLAAQHPGLTQAALVGLAGLLFKNRKGGLSGSLVKLGGLAVIGGLAYRVLQARTGPRPAAPAPAADEIGAPPGNRFHSISQTEDDALLLLRTMIAAASADGQIDEAERARILRGMTEAGIDPQSGSWLDNEFASPADVDALAEPVNDPETASQVYAAARITIDPDTLQERDFLRRLADALDLDDAILEEIDAAVVALRNS
jgi:uncharacterized membrane protein YebE (DUF533 family)